MLTADLIRRILSTSYPPVRGVCQQHRSTCEDFLNAAHVTASAEASWISIRKENFFMRAAAKYLAILIVAFLVPASALAQASITGVVRDSSGGVLPGVTVEAASPVLIEKVRSAVTDNAGQ